MGSVLEQIFVKCY